MPQVLSKFSPISTTCVEYVHPWTDNCVDASSGLLVSAAAECLRIYTAVYTVSLLMRGKIPKWNDIFRTIQGILQSSAFLTTSAFTFSGFLCFLRYTMGTFNFFTVSYIPAFLSSISAILVERPSRRGLLCLYVSNVATETLWRMAVSRNIVRPIKNGRTLIFGISSAILTYYYRTGLHKITNDSLFGVFRFVVGKNEEHNYELSSIPYHQQIQEEQYYKILLFLEEIKIFKKHKTCPHHGNCLSYTIQGGTKLFLVGIGLQSILKLVLNAKRILTNPFNIKKVFFNRDIIKLGLFLGEFAALFRGCSCLLRHCTGTDNPLYSIPAGLIAGLSFSNYPDNSIALYIMWKMLQITYNMGIEKGVVPKVPGFTILLYCLSTATLFHAAMLEPKNLRPSYWKFLHSLSGGRIAQMDRKPLDVWGLETSKQLAEVMKRTGTNVVPL